MLRLQLSPWGIIMGLENNWAKRNAARDAALGRGSDMPKIRNTGRGNAKSAARIGIGTGQNSGRFAD
jgi:hypothetical protein